MSAFNARLIEWPATPVPFTEDELGRWMQLEHDVRQRVIDDQVLYEARNIEVLLERAAKIRAKRAEASE